MSREHPKHIFKVIAIVLIAVLFARYPAVLVTYQLNKTYISENLCEMKMETNNMCDGKCWLKKKLLAAKHKDQKESPFAEITKIKI